MILTKTKQNTGIIKNISEVAKELFLLDIEIDNDFNSSPGQFISVFCENYTLRRPFSIMNFKNGILSLLFKLKGGGTEYISKLKTGDRIDFTGPFGNGFEIKDEKALLIGGGVGIAPLYYLRNVLRENNAEHFFMGGFLTETSVPKALDFDFVSTDDGSYGKKGFVCDYTKEIIEKFSPKVIYACGPFQLLKRIHFIVKEYNIPLYVAMEKEMACSIGVCRGCVIELTNGRNVTVCKDGPVFLSEAIRWD